MKIFEILETVGAKSLERGSVDEAYMDVSNLVDERISDQQRQQQPSWPLNFEASVVVAGEDFVTPNGEVNAATVDEAQQQQQQQQQVDDMIIDPAADRQTCIRLWHGAEISKQIRKQVYDKLGYTVSCGISFNKVKPEIYRENFH